MSPNSFNPLVVPLDKWWWCPLVNFGSISNLLSGIRWVKGTKTALRSGQANICVPLCQPLVAPTNSSSSSIPAILAGSPKSPIHLITPYNGFSLSNTCNSTKVPSSGSVSGTSWSLRNSGNFSDDSSTSFSLWTAMSKSAVVSLNNFF